MGRNDSWKVLIKTLDAKAEPTMPMRIPSVEVSLVGVEKNLGV